MKNVVRCVECTRLCGVMCVAVGSGVCLCGGPGVAGLWVRLVWRRSPSVHCAHRYSATAAGRGRAALHAPAPRGEGGQ